MEFAKRLTVFRIFGGILVLLSLFGFMFVADEFHHFGEFLGVTCIFVSGVILLLIESRFNIFKKCALQWISFSLLASIPLGGIVLDNMPLGLTIGFVLGIILGILFGRSELSK